MKACSKIPVALIAKHYNTKVANEYARVFIDAFEKVNWSCIQVKNENTSLANLCEKKNIEVALAIGGDGTVLRTVQILQDLNIKVPILGINIGSLGFLTQISAPCSEKAQKQVFLEKTIQKIVNKIIENDYSIEKKPSLEILEFNKNEQKQNKVIHGFEKNNSIIKTGNRALNEISIHRNNLGKVLQIAVSIDNKELISYGCDGIVVCPPTGSTGYAFSAGGPILFPTVEAFMLVPISAHSLFARPIIVNKTSQIEIKILDLPQNSATLSLDGCRSISLLAGTTVKIGYNENKTIDFLKIDNLSFAEKLVNKFNLPALNFKAKR